MFKSNSADNSTTTGVEPGAYKLPDAAKYCGGISIISLRRLIAKGQIKPCRGLRHVLVAKAELDRFLTQ